MVGVIFERRRQLRKVVFEQVGMDSNIFRNLIAEFQLRWDLGYTSYLKFRHFKFMYILSSL